MRLRRNLVSQNLSLLVASLLPLALGCATSPPTAAESNGSPQTFAAQVTAGQTLYAQNCAECHGASGQGDTAPRLVGLKEGALPLDPPAERKFRKSRFVTVADVADFAAHNMPPKKGGSLTADEYWAIVAFDLHANGIDLEKKLTPEVAATLTIPR
jgi:S-disulfanyl-L-cysteine oxidoreductase SoxD